MVEAQRLGYCPVCEYGKDRSPEGGGARKRGGQGKGGAAAKSAKSSSKPAGSPAMPSRVKAVGGGLVKAGKGVASKAVDVAQHDGASQATRTRDAQALRKAEDEARAQREHRQRQVDRDQFCSNCGARARGNFCRTCGASLNDDNFEVVSGGHVMPRGKMRETTYVVKKREIMKGKNAAKVDQIRIYGGTKANAAAKRRIPKPIALASGLVYTLTCTGAKKFKLSRNKSIVCYEVSVQWSNVCWIIYRRFGEFTKLFYGVRDKSKHAALRIQGVGKHASFADSKAMDARAREVSAFVKNIEKNQRELLKERAVRKTLERFFAPVGFNDLKQPGKGLPFKIEL